MNFNYLILFSYLQCLSFFRTLKYKLVKKSSETINDERCWYSVIVILVAVVFGYFCFNLLELVADLK